MPVTIKDKAFRLIGVYAPNIRVGQEALSWRIDQCDTVETGSFSGNVDLDHAGGVVELTFLSMLKKRKETKL